MLSIKTTKIQGLSSLALGHINVTIVITFIVVFICILSSISIPLVIDPRFYDLLVELKDQIKQQNIEMTNQHKEFNQSQEKMEATIQQNS